MRDQETKNAISIATVFSALPFLLMSLAMLFFGWAGEGLLMRVIYPIVLMLVGLSIIGFGLRKRASIATSIPNEEVKHLTCPNCKSDMDEGIIRTRTTTIERLIFTTWLTNIDLWFYSKRNRDFLVVPKGQTKEAFRCVECGTTVILRGL